ncbi:MAG: RNA polymerase sporulation sigma factor SigK [Erysipelotrichales bacterium]|nr:RNA polymerase sporulation sigma factor SigK [Erysipelotrichales bacterium]
MRWFRRCLTYFRRLVFPKGCYFIQSGEVLPKPLSKEEEEHYLELLEGGDEEARNMLIEHNLRLVVYIAKRYETNPVHMEDLISIGIFGLIKAIHTFKRDKNIKLVTYASRCIENEILMHLRKKSKRKMEVSFDEPLNVDYDGNELVLSDILGTQGDIVAEEFEKREQMRMLYKAISSLKTREKEILLMRYGIDQEELTQKDVAGKLGISQSYISRLEKRILYKLRLSLRKYM